MTPKPRRKRGRPRTLPEGHTRPSVTLSREERAVLDRACQRAGWALADWLVTHALLAAVEDGVTLSPAERAAIERRAGSVALREAEARRDEDL